MKFKHQMFITYKLDEDLVTDELKKAIGKFKLESVFREKEMPLTLITDYDCKTKKVFINDNPLDTNNYNAYDIGTIVDLYVSKGTIEFTIYPGNYDVLEQLATDMYQMVLKTNENIDNVEGVYIIPYKYYV